MNRSLGVMAVLAVLAAGCASRGSVRELRADVTALAAELAGVRAAQTSAARDLARAQEELTVLDARLGAIGTSVGAVAADVARLAGRVDAADAALRETRARVDALPAAAPPPAERRPAPRARPAPPQTAESAEQAYAAALATFRAREHGQAVLDFLDFIAKHPRHALAGNAQYWIGEAYYVQRDHRQALAEFQKVLELGAGKVADALVKIGLCYVNLRDIPRARAAWRRVVREHGDSGAAATARGLLRTHTASRRR
ncbi:MAG: tetratricopeptide repeat protein [Candidatus Rokubacteria bacterium]|nr:tetratricopeptide repeat protein [Candidatus Rokubacteria bacterium]MBI4628046.1 tetratricopeptide repeat protein [Candidatus Rokubacteria bacterium]